MQRRRRDHIPVIAAHIDPVPEFTDRVADGPFRVGKVIVPTARSCDDLQRPRNLVLLDSLIATVLRVDIKDRQLGVRTGSDTDVIGAAIAKPPLYLSRVRAGILDAIRRGRMLRDGKQFSSNFIVYAILFISIVLSPVGST